MKLTAFLLFISVSCFGQFTKTQLNGALHLVNYANNKNENVTDNILDITVIGGGGGVQNGAMVLQGPWDASTNVVPFSGSGVSKGWYWVCSVASTTLLGPDGGIIPVGVSLLALVDNPGTDVTDSTKWLVIY